MENAVIFDLDGTLWDSTGCASAIWNRVFDKHREITFRMTQDLAASLMGKTMPEIGRALFPEMEENLRMRIVDDFGAEEVAYLRENGAMVYEGTERTLSILKENCDLYIVSNCQDGYVPAFLHAHHMEAYITDIEMSGRTGMDKGENIRLLMARNGVETAVYVGDTEGDEKAARYANIPFVWASYGFGKAKAPDAVIRSIADLPLCLEKMWHQSQQPPLNG